MDDNQGFIKTIEAIKQSSRIGIIISPSPTGARLDYLVSGEILGRVLKLYEKQFGFLAQPPTGILSDHKLFKILLEPPALPRDFLISIDTSRYPVSGLRYEKQDDRIEVILSPEKHPISQEAVSFRNGNVWCDCIIVIGVLQREQMLQIFERVAGFAQDIPVIFLDLYSKKYDDAPENYIFFSDPAAISVSELVHLLLFELLEDGADRFIDAEIATLLLVGVFEHSDGMRYLEKKYEKIGFVGDLLKKGADLSYALSLVRQQRPLGLVQLAARAMVRSRYGSGNMFFSSFLLAEDFDKTQRDSGDIEFVLLFLLSEFPHEKLIALFWESKESNQISIAIGGDDELLERIQQKTSGRREDGIFYPTSFFSEFRQAEEYVSALLL